MDATSGGRSEPRQDARARRFDRSIERAIKDSKVSPQLAGLFRALLVRRRRSGDDRIRQDEGALLRLLSRVFQGDPAAQEHAAAIVRQMIGLP